MKNWIRNLLLAATLLPATMWAATITDTVRNSAGGAVIVGATVTVNAVGNGGGGTCTTNATGICTLSAAQVGTTLGARTVTVAMTGFTTNTGTVTITTAAQVVTRAVALVAVAVNGTLTGTVTNSAGGAALDSALVVVRLGGAGTPILDSARTSITGTYTITGLAAGTTYRITASKTGFTAVTVTPDTITAGGTKTTNFALTAVVTTPGTISGTVTSAGTGTAIANALVTLQQGGVGTPILDSVRTSATGAYSITGLAAAANYRVTVTVTGYATATNTPVTVTAGATTTSNFALTATVGNIIGTVTAAGVPVANALVVVRRGSATGAILDSVRTNTSGAYVVIGVASGTPNYWITATSGASTGTNANVAVTTGGTTTSNIALAAASLFQTASNTQGIRFSSIGNQLALDLGVSNVTRTVTVYSLNGVLRNQTSVPAGVSRAVLPAAFAPANGFLFQVK